MHRGFIIWIYLGTFCVLVTTGDASPCCGEAVTSRDCMDACERVSQESDTEVQLHQLSHVAQVCPKHLAKSRDMLSPQCRISSEMAFFRCIERQEVSDECCGMSTSSRCTAVCRAIFFQDSPPTDSQSSMVAGMCDTRVASCVHNFTSAMPSNSPVDSLPCCNHSTSAECRSRCARALQTLSNEADIVEEVSKYCGTPNVMDNLWQCFLRSSNNHVRNNFNYGGSIEETGIDGAKLQCCRKALSSNCRNLCVRTFSNTWTTSVRFHEECSYNPDEAELNMCLEEVEEPCKIGCSGLDFCTNFNYRPTEMFRTCSSEADRQAQRTMRIWAEGTISLPGKQSSLLQQYDIPVKPLRHCKPNVWKAVVCTLQIKPCHENVRSTQICKSDCLALLHECLDQTRLTRGVSAETICNELSPQNEHLPCISVAQYMVPSSLRSEFTEVTNPCSPSPCEDREVCMINRRQCKPGNNCRDYVCKPGCSMGEVLTHVVPHKSYVQLPMVSSRQLNCYRVCKCGHHNLLHKCKDMACVEESRCQLRMGMEQEHNTKFTLDCNLCVCHGGNVVCTKRQCTYTSQRYTGLPCNCPSNYVPVCGHNGRTYPSACIARCLGLTDDLFEFGRCASKDPCSSYPCAVGEKCIARNQVCLSSNANDCHQYECIRQSDEGCQRHQNSPVCDTEHREVPSMCLLMVYNRQLDHRGHCMEGCEKEGTVCGVNGETYHSECAAWAAGATVDYYGNCIAVGQLPYMNAREPRCYNVECPSPTRWPHCQLITPPGACCPTCAGEIRVLFSESQADRASHVTNKGPITVQDVRTVLQQQISVKECDVFVYISIEGDLVILTAPIVAKATIVQVDACMVETRRIFTLIDSSSPTLMSHIAMATFLSADIRTAKPRALALESSCSSSFFPFLTFISLLLTVYQLRKL